MVRRGAVLADVGTDHAYLPIHLLKEGIIDRAVCSDINEGPLASARENLLEEGLSDRAELCLTSGAEMLSGKGITDCAVCGMGEIIENAPWLKNEGVHLILQPMTKHEILRTYLAESGFSVIEERYSFDEGKYYVAFLCKYSGKSYEISPYEAYFGALANGVITDSAQIGYLKGKLSALRKIMNGKMGAGLDFSEERSLIEEFSKRAEIQS